MLDMEFLDHPVSFDVLAKKRSTRAKWIDEYKYRLKGNTDYILYSNDRPYPNLPKLMKAKMEKRLLQQAIDKLTKQLKTIDMMMMVIGRNPSSQGSGNAEKKRKKESDSDDNNNTFEPPPMLPDHLMPW